MPALEQDTATATNGAIKRLRLWLALLLLSLGILAIISLSSRLSINLSYLRLNRALVGDATSASNVGDDFARRTNDPIVARKAQRGLALALASQFDAPETVRAWQSFPGGVDEARQWARRAERNKDWQAAAGWLGLLTRLEPDNGDNWYRLAPVQLALGQPLKATLAYETGLAASDHGEFRPSNYLTRLGELARQSEVPDWQLVHDRFDDAIAQDDFAGVRDLALARMGRAEAFEKLGSPSDALRDYRWVAARQPSNYWAHAHSGRLTWFVEHDAETAVAYLQKAIDINDQLKWALRDLAIVFAQTNRAEDAVGLFRQVLVLDPTDPIATEQLHALQGSDED